MTTQTSQLATQDTAMPRTFKQRARSLALPYYKPSRTRLLPSWGRYVLMRPFIFETWYRLRALRLRLTHGFKEQAASASKEQDGFMDDVRSYNRGRQWEFARVRTEKLMALLRCVETLPREARILVIGPRNEAEILLLSLYGWRLKNIQGVDLFTYSPRIRLGDMHALDFPDGSFDVVYTAWTLSYAYDLPRACKEIVRVLKDGGLVVTGMDQTQRVTHVTGTKIHGGLDPLLEPFQPWLDSVLWQEVAPIPATDAQQVTAIFRIRKRAA